jgi:hypothetical protein
MKSNRGKSGLPIKYFDLPKNRTKNVQKTCKTHGFCSVDVRNGQNNAPYVLLDVRMTTTYTVYIFKSGSLNQRVLGSSPRWVTR